MRRYSENIEPIWTNYKIIVPTEEDKKELEEAFEHLHYTDCDTDNVAVNQLIHEYITPERTGNPESKNSIIVNKELFDWAENFKLKALLEKAFNAGRKRGQYEVSGQDLEVDCPHFIGWWNESIPNL